MFIFSRLWELFIYMTPVLPSAHGENTPCVMLYKISVTHPSLSAMDNPLRPFYRMIDKCHTLSVIHKACNKLWQPVVSFWANKYYMNKGVNYRIFFSFISVTTNLAFSQQAAIYSLFILIFVLLQPTNCKIIIVTLVNKLVFVNCLWTEFSFFNVTTLLHTKTLNRCKTFFLLE